MDQFTNLMPDIVPPAGRPTTSRLINPAPTIVVTAVIFSLFRRAFNNPERLRRRNSAGNSLLKIVSICCWATGCATSYLEIPDTLSPDYIVGEVPHTGLVTGSVTSLPTGEWQEWSVYYFRSLTDPSVGGQLRSGSDDLYGKLTVPFAYLRYPDYKKCAEEPALEAECGRLFVLELPAGDYEVWKTALPGTGSTAAWSVLLSNYRFTVEEGQTTYLGNLNNRICIGHIGNSNLIIAVSGEVEDQYARDWPLLVARFPFLADQSVDAKVLQGDSWRRRLWEEGERFWERTAWEPEYGWEACDRQATKEPAN